MPGNYMSQHSTDGRVVIGRLAPIDLYRMNLWNSRTCNSYDNSKTERRFGKPTLPVWTGKKIDLLQ